MSNRLILLGTLTIIISSLCGCGTFEKATTLDPTTNYFPAKKNKHAETLERVEVERERLKSCLLVVPSTDYWLQMGANLNYFDEVMTVSEFESSIVQKGLTDEIPSISDAVGLARAYEHYRPFVLLNPTKVQKPGEGWFAGLFLYDPKNAEVVFQNEIWLNLMWDGWTDQGTMFPLFNSMLAYLREEKN